MPTPRVLIVDDDAAIRRLLRVITERNGLIADEAADGRECLNLLSAQRYDLVLLDLSMPRCNGFDVIDTLRHLAEPPAVIVVSALAKWVFTDLDCDVVTCVVRKPFDAEALSWVIVDVATGLNASRRRTTGERPAPPLSISDDISRPRA